MSVEEAPLLLELLVWISFSNTVSFVNETWVVLLWQWRDWTTGEVAQLQGFAPGLYSNLLWIWFHHLGSKPQTLHLHVELGLCSWGETRKPSLIWKACSTALAPTPHCPAQLCVLPGCYRSQDRHRISALAACQARPVQSGGNATLPVFLHYRDSRSFPRLASLRGLLPVSLPTPPPLRIMLCKLRSLLLCHEHFKFTWCTLQSFQ